MTLEELGRRVCEGQFLIVGEVRAADVREAGFVDKKTGQAAKTLLVTYFVELRRHGGFGLMKITRRALPGVTDPAQVSVGVEVGGHYAFEIETVEQKPGFLVARMAKVEPEAMESSGPPLGAPQGAPAADA